MEIPPLNVLVAKRQSPGNREYFASRMSQCFSVATGPSWLDVCLDTALLETPVTAPSPNGIHNDSKTPLFSSDSVSTSPATLKVESELALRQLLRSHDAGRVRIFFIRQKNSASRLSVSWRLFDAMCQQCAIFDRVRDYVMCFGLRNGELEITPPAMHYYISWTGYSRQAIDLECAYVLRFVELSSRQQRNPWSMRQSAIYHKFESEKSSSTWTFIALSPSAEILVKEWLTTLATRPVHDPFELHYILFDIAVSSWRRYVVYLADEIRQQADRAIVADLETDGEVVTRLEERQYLKQLEDSVTDLLSALSFMLENIDALISCYQDFQTQFQPGNHSNLGSQDSSGVIMKGLTDRKRDLLRLSSQAEALRRKVNSAANLVSNILDLNNGNALKVLALESRAENANMALLTRKSVQDAAMVKVLTIVTLVYLPVTVVTNFFSTQFVNSVETSDGTGRLVVRPQVWILFAASVPLTVFTIYIWWIFAQREVRGDFPGGWKDLSRRLRAASQSLRRRPVPVSASIDHNET